MKALIKKTEGPGNVEIKNVENPMCGADEVKIEVKYSGICGTDLHIYHGSFKCYPPVILGHEFSGVVVDIGKDIKKVKKGDRVTVLPSTAKICGDCMYCRQGKYSFCDARRGMGYGMHGSFTKYVVVREDMVYKIPNHISFEVATLAEPLACVVQGLEELEQISVGDTVLISGPGPIGLIALSLLKSRGIKVIIAGTNQDGSRLKLAKEMGADIVVNINLDNLKEIIKVNTKNKGVDFAVECAGHPSSINGCLEVLKKEGTLIQLGIIGTDININYDAIMYKQLKIQGSITHSLSTWEKVMQIFEQDNLNLKSLVTHKFCLDEWQKAFDICESKQGGKVLIYYE